MDSNDNTVPIKFISMNTTENKFYIYAWFYKDTNKVFYIGKGCNKRWIDVVNHRNQYFKNIIKKEKDNIDVKKLKENLFEQEAYILERQLIQEYWQKGECKANFHEGGCGGNHGNYSENMRKKLSEFASTRVGEKNPMYRHEYTEEQRKHLSEGQKNSKYCHLQKSEEAKNNMSIAQKKFWNSEQGLLLRKKISERPIKRPENWGIHNAESHCTNNYIIKFEDDIIFETRYQYEVFSYCKEKFNISRTIVESIMKQEWIPKFNKHQYLKSLKIIVEKDKFKGVSTNPDECKDVE